MGHYTPQFPKTKGHFHRRTGENGRIITFVFTLPKGRYAAPKGMTASL